MAFFLQHRAIQRQAESDLILAASDQPTEQFYADLRYFSLNEDADGERRGPGRIPGITLKKDDNKELYYQVDWTGPDDSFNPKTWSTLRRIGSTLIVCLVAFVATLSSAIDSAVVTDTMAEFHVSDVAASLTTAIFLIGFGIGSLLCSPLSVLLGRYPVYLGSLCVFGCWILGAALAPNFGAHLVFRFLAGFASSTPLTVAGGTMGDLWSPLEKTFAFPMFAIPAFGGPVFGPLTVKGPVVGAYIGYLPDISWRWSEWVVLIAVGATILLLGLSAEETFAPRLLQYKAKRFRELTGNDKFKTAMEASHPSRAGVVRKCFRQPFSLGREPIVIAFTFYLTFIYIVFFTFLDGWPYIFGSTYSINEGLSNICFVTLFVGILCSIPLVAIVYRITAKQLERDGDDGSGKLLNRESRMIFAMVGAPALPVGLFWMAWTDYASISIWVPLVGAALVCFSNVCVFMSAYMYVIDSYEAAAAGALTFVALVRYVAAGVMTVVGVPMYKNLGTHWALTTLAIISTVATPIPYVIHRYGTSLRKRSKWAV